MSTSTQKTGAGGGRVPKREGGRVLRISCSTRSARGPVRSGKARGSAARPERHDGGRGSEPIFFWRGAAMMQSPSPVVPWLRALLPAFSSPFLLRRVDVSRPARLYPSLYFSLTDSCLSYVFPRATGPVRGRAPPSPAPRSTGPRIDV